MSTLAPLLATKLYPPRVRPHLVRRPRLVARLAGGLARPLTLISAPAGFGKTTLVSEWRTELGGDFQLAWLSLDPDDDDPATFLSYLVASLQTVQAGVGVAAQAPLQSQESLSAKVVVTLLINELSSTSTPMALVLDDYHVITAQPIHEALAYLMEHLPPNLHVIVTTRADPPLPLTRWRAQDQLVEIRAADLRFTPDESVSFLNDTMGLDLLVEQVTALENRTEGWVAGLQLAALALQGRRSAQEPGQVAEFIDGFSGSHHYIAGYLADDVVAHLPDSVQAFLLQTAILDRLSAPLCAAVTGQSEAQSMLEQLEGANLFLIPLDDHGQWYRYHHLFAEVLRHRLHQVLPDQVAELHRRAYNWLRHNGLPAEAIPHAIAAGDFDLAIELIESLTGPSLPPGQWATLRHWLESLPAEVLAGRPQLSLQYARTLIFTGRLDEYEAPLRLAEQAWQTQGNTVKLVEVLNMRAQMARLQGNASRTLELAQQSLALLPEGDQLLRGISLEALGAAYLLSGRAAEALPVLEESRALCESAGDTLSMLLSSEFCGEALMAMGQLRRAAEVFRQVVAASGGRRLWPNILAHVGLGELAYEWNDLAVAQGYVRKAIDMAEETDRRLYIAPAFVALSRVRLALGDRTEADTLLGQAEEVAARLGHQADLSRTSMARMLWRLTGDDLDLGQAAALASTRQRAENAMVAYDGEKQWMAYARWLIREGRAADAVTLLNRLSEAAQSGGRARDVIAAAVALAVAHRASGANAAARQALEGALTLAAPEGYVRVFLDEGEPVRRLLAEGRSEFESDLARAYAEQLLAAFDSSTRAPPLEAIRPSKPVATPLVEPLSPRELEVLQAIADGLSNREIAQRLVVAVSTIKVHTKNIYGKLNVKSRTQAVARARALRLL